MWAIGAALANSSRGICPTVTTGPFSQRGLTALRKVETNPNNTVFQGAKVPYVARSRHARGKRYQTVTFSPSLVAPFHFLIRVALGATRPPPLTGCDPLPRSNAVDDAFQRIRDGETSSKHRGRRPWEASPEAEKGRLRQDENIVSTSEAAPRLWTGQRTQNEYALRPLRRGRF
jgi:hypothetical protein